VCTNYSRTRPDLPASAYAINLHIKRNIESTYGILIPTISLFAILGATMLLSGEHELRNRLAAFGSLFVLAWSVYNSVGRYIPEPARGISLIEALLTSSVLYAVVFFVYTTCFIALKTQHPSWDKWEVYVNLIPILVVCLLMVGFPILKEQNATFTLLGLIPNSWFSALLVALVSFGGILNILLKHAIRSSDSGQNSSKLPPRAGVPSLISADRKSTNSNRSDASVLCLILVGLFIVAATVRHLRGLGCDV